MNIVISKIKKHIENNYTQFIKNFLRLLECPSVSTDKEGIEKAVDVIVELLKEVGADVKTYKIDGGNPIIYGEIKGDKNSSIMFYDHYDVQPVDPLDRWISPPFKPRIEDDKIYARGASDDKGNLISRILAVKTLKDSLGELPVNVKFLFEGEEEIGSPSLPKFVINYKEQLKADVCIWEGGGFNKNGRPMIYLGAKGVIYVELRVKRRGDDLHSSWGTIIENPAWRLVSALSTIRDIKGRILIDGFYDEVIDDPEAEELISKINIDRSEIEAMTSNGELIEDLPLPDLLRRWLLSPTVNICGIYSGYVEKGQKTVLPSHGFAKLDIRIVPRMHPDRVLMLLKKHLAKFGFSDVEVEILNHGYPAARTSPNTPQVRLAKLVAEAVSSKEAVVFPNIAGSGPIYLITDILGQPCFSFGVNHPGSNIHAPNENLIINNFMKGILQCSLYLLNFDSWVRLGNAPYLNA